MTKRVIATSSQENPQASGSSTVALPPSSAQPGSGMPSDVELAFTNSEFIGLVLTLIQRMATEFSHRNDDGPYSHVLDGLTQVACGSKGPITDVSKKYFRERLEATVRAGLVDRWPNPKVHRKGQLLYLKDYVPFHEHGERHGYNQRRWARCEYALTGVAEIQDSEYGEREHGLTAFYCRLIEAEGHDLGDYYGGTTEADAQHFPAWNRQIYIPARDILQAPVRMYMED